MPEIINLNNADYQRACEQAKDFLAGIFVKPLIITVGERGIVRSRFVDCADQYSKFNGKLNNTPLLISTTEFAEKIYRTLLKLNPGETISYSELALRAGYKGAARAVGSVMAKNRHPWIIPCHKVVKADGKPGNYTVSNECSCKNLKLRLIEFEKR